MKALKVSHSTLQCLKKIYGVFNPLYATVCFLNPLKTPENLYISYGFRGYRKTSSVKWVKRFSWHLVRS